MLSIWYPESSPMIKASQRHFNKAAILLMWTRGKLSTDFVCSICEDNIGVSLKQEETLCDKAEEVRNFKYLDGKDK